MTDLNTVAEALVAGTAAAGATAYGLARWRRRKEPGPIHYFRLQSMSVPYSVRTTRVGGLLVVPVGTYGVHQAKRLLDILYYSGLDALVGGIILAEHDPAIRQHFLGAVPMCYLDRITPAFSPELPGFNNGTVEAALACSEKWAAALTQATKDAVLKYQEHNPGVVPTLIIQFQSLGGQAVTGLPITNTLRQHFPETSIVAGVALPVHESLRQNFKVVKAAYEACGVQAWLVQDNLALDVDNSDYVQVASFAAMADSAAQADRTGQINNLINLIIGRRPGGLIALQSATTWIPGRFDAAAPDYIAPYDVIINAARHCIGRVDTGQGVWSIDLPVAEPGTSVTDLLITGVRHEDTGDLRAELTQGFEARYLLYQNTKKHLPWPQVPSMHGQLANREFLVGSIGTPINPVRPLCPVLAVRFARVIESADLIDQVIALPHQRRAA
jgi:hypothetical protein